MKVCRLDTFVMLVLFIFKKIIIKNSESFTVVEISPQ